MSTLISLGMFPQQSEPDEIGQEAASPIGKVPISRPRTRAIYRTERTLEAFWGEAKELGISPPASSDPQDLIEYQTRVSKLKETLPSWWNQKRFKDWGI